jgi:hypothetical protein
MAKFARIFFLGLDVWLGLGASGLEYLMILMKQCEKSREEDDDDDDDDDDDNHDDE